MTTTAIVSHGPAPTAAAVVTASDGVALGGTIVADYDAVVVVPVGEWPRVEARAAVIEEREFVDLLGLEQGVSG